MPVEYIACSFASGFSVALGTYLLAKGQVLNGAGFIGLALFLGLLSISFMIRRKG